MSHRQDLNTLRSLEWADEVEENAENGASALPADLVLAQLKQDKCSPTGTSDKDNSPGTQRPDFQWRTGGNSQLLTGKETLSGPVGKEHGSRQQLTGLGSQHAGIYYSPEEAEDAYEDCDAAWEGANEETDERNFKCMGNGQRMQLVQEVQSAAQDATGMSAAGEAESWIPRQRRTLHVLCRAAFPGNRPEQRLRRATALTLATAARKLPVPIPGQPISRMAPTVTLMVSSVMASGPLLAFGHPQWVKVWNLTGSHFTALDYKHIGPKIFCCNTHMQLGATYSSGLLTYAEPMSLWVN